MRRFASMCVLAVALLRSAAADSLSVENGNICLTDDAKQVKALTSSGLDSEPVFSPDRRYIIFVRGTLGKTVPTGSDNSPATELWQIKANGKDAILLVRGKASEKMETVLANFSKPHFSSNGRYVFFLSDAWATSGAVHVVDTTNGKEHFVCPGNDLEVVMAGEYRDCLLVQQHRYFIGGGSYDWFWLLRSDGKEVGPVGEDSENFKSTYGKE